MKEIIAKTYHEAEAFLSEIPKFTKKNPFEETKGFYTFIQNCDNGRYCEKNLGKIIHIAGTNGKGSVCAFLQSICIESGYKTAMFTSPHLRTTRERFCIDGKMISEEAFVEAFNWLTKNIERYQYQMPDYCPTYFERLFFMGIYIFARAGVAVTILETGLGGRLDTTNVIRQPVLTVITQIGLDHMEYLGTTIEAIAAEKAGIIKPKIPVIFSDRKKAASDVIRKKAVQSGCLCEAVSKNDYKINEFQKKYIDFSVSSLYYDYGSFLTGTTAAYQVENAAVSIRACEILKKECDFDKITVQSIKEGILNMHWAGRMEEIGPGVFIDGAHNEDGIAAFVQSVQNMHDFAGIGKKGSCVLIFSVVKDKQYDKMIEMLCSLQMITDFVLTHIPGGRGADLVGLQELFVRFTKDSGQRIHIFEEIEDAVAFGLLARGENGVSYVVGSLYLAGLVEEIIDVNGGYHDRF